MYRHGMDGGPVWLGDSKWQRRPGSIGCEGEKRVFPGQRQPGQTGAAPASKRNVPIYRIDYKNSIVYLAHKLDCDVGCYIKMQDVLNIYGKVSWNNNRGLPPFPTFVPPVGEDVAAMATEDCQLVSTPLFHQFRDEFHSTALVSQSDIDDARAAKPAAPPPKKKMYDYKKYVEYRKKAVKAAKNRRKVVMKRRMVGIKAKQDEDRRRKIMERRRVK
jgi:hypothetical protein